MVKTISATKVAIINTAIVIVFGVYYYSAINDGLGVALLRLSFVVVVFMLIGRCFYAIGSNAK